MFRMSSWAPRTRAPVGSTTHPSIAPSLPANAGDTKNRREIQPASNVPAWRHMLPLIASVDGCRRAQARRARLRLGIWNRIAAHPVADKPAATPAAVTAPDTPFPASEKLDLCLRQPRRVLRYKKERRNGECAVASIPG